MATSEERLDLMAELDAIVDLGRRAPGSDAERRTALHLRQRLEALNRAATVEPFAVYATWPLAYALLAAAAVGASVLSVYVPIAGAIVAFVVALLTFLDAGLLIPTVRRLLGRRASQNVVSLADGGKPGAIFLVAHYDAGRGGLVHTDAVARRRPRIGGLQLLVWAELAVLACALLRLTGLDGTALTVVQFVPTLVLIVAVALLADVALAQTRAGENDNASGAVLALRLAERLGAATEHFDLHVLFTGAQTAGSAGLLAFLDSHGQPHHSTVFLNLDRVGSGAVRYTRAEGALLKLESQPQLQAICDQIAEDDDTVGSIVSRATSDASAASGRGYAAITITCRDRLDYASGRVEENALERAEHLCVELIERLDAELGPVI